MFGVVSWLAGSLARLRLTLPCCWLTATRLLSGGRLLPSAASGLLGACRLLLTAAGLLLTTTGLLLTTTGLLLTAARLLLTTARLLLTTARLLGGRGLRLVGAWLLSSAGLLLTAAGARLLGGRGLRLAGAWLLLAVRSRVLPGGAGQLVLDGFAYTAFGAFLRFKGAGGLLGFIHTGLDGGLGWRAAACLAGIILLSLLAAARLALGLGGGLASR